MDSRTLLLVAGPAAALTMTMAVATQDRFPDAPGKAELVSVCGDCHEPEVVFAHPQTAGGWSDTLGSMAQAGAQATDAQWRLIEKYLHSQLALIPINKATAAEIQATFDVPESVAQGVVKYREANGNFKSIDEVKKVPALEASTVDARKERLIF